MTRILALDVSAEFGGVALIEGGVVAAESPLHEPTGFSQVIFNRIEEVLARKGWKPGDIDCFASASGPGSFTGVRIGLAAAKGLAEALNKPMVAVSNLRALAWYGTGALRAAFVDARRGEIYGSVYSADLVTVLDERVMKFGAWVESLPPGPLEFITPDPLLFPTVAAIPGPRQVSGAVGLIAAREYEAGRAVDPVGVDANYVRRSDAELLWRDR